MPEELVENMESSVVEVNDIPFEVEEPMTDNGVVCPNEEKIEDINFSADEELKTLRAEVERLRAEAERLAEGYAELMELYPSAQLGSMPDSFKEAVKCGVPPAAAYALEMRRREVRAKRAEAARRSAEKSSAGRISTVDDGLFTPDEVRGMSRREVRENYGRIMESMRHWK
jgi:hypothetical protein